MPAIEKDEVLALAKKVLEDEGYVIVDEEDADAIWGLTMELHSWVRQNKGAVPEPLGALLDDLIGRLVRAIGNMGMEGAGSGGATVNARKCRWCARRPCPYPDDGAFRRQLEEAGREWLETMPCWEPFPENVGVIHDRDGNYLPGVDPERPGAAVRP